MATERYTCHEDGSTDCPCLVAEKTIKLIGMTVRARRLRAEKGRRAALPPPAAACRAQEGSQKFTIAPGECKSFCTCGLSKNFPLCALRRA